jgi:hypothetical protein
MPNAATSLALVETATKWLAMAAISPFSPASSQSPGMREGHGLERRESLGGDDEERLGGVEIGHRLGEIRAVDVGDEAEVMLHSL